MVDDILKRYQYKQAIDYKNKQIYGSFFWYFSCNWLNIVYVFFCHQMSFKLVIQFSLSTFHGLRFCHVNFMFYMVSWSHWTLIKSLNSLSSLGLFLIPFSILLFPFLFNQTNTFHFCLNKQKFSIQALSTVSISKTLISFSITFGKRSNLLK